MSGKLPKIRKPHKRGSIDPKIIEIAVKKAMDDNLRDNLKDLIELWEEVAHMGNIDGGMQKEYVTRHDCMNDLQEILNGDYSCIEKIDS